MRRRSKSLALLAVAFLGLAGTSASPGATAADEPDTTPPTVHLDEWAHYTVGSIVDARPFEDGSLYWSTTPTSAWQAGDASGICSQEVAWTGYDAHYDDPDDVLGYAQHIQVDPAARTFHTNEVVNMMDDARGTHRWVVRVTDCAGNKATSNIAAIRFGVLDDKARAIAYKGGWKRAAADGAVLDTLHTTRTRGASLSSRFSGGPVGLVARTGPDHGALQVWVDGRLAATVSAYAPARADGVVLWEGYYASGNHTIKVVNLATRGRPKASFDALLLCEGFVTNPGGCSS